MTELITCHRCDAKFDPTVQWEYGWRPKNDTSGVFYSSGSIPLGHCPICRKPPLLEELYDGTI